MEIINNYNFSLRIFKMDFNLTLNLIKKRKAKVHDSYSYLTLILEDGRLAASHCDNFYIYNLDNLKCEVLIKTEEYINSIHQLSNGKIIIHSNIVEIYNISKRRYERIYYIENDNLIHSIIPISEDRMVSAGSINELIFWNSNYPYNILYSKNLENVKNCCIEIKTKTNNLLVLADLLEFKLIFYSLDTYKNMGSVPTMNEVHDGILETSNNKLIVLNRYNLCVINLKNLLIEHKYLPFKNQMELPYISCTEIAENIILMGDYNNSLYIFNFDRGLIKKQRKRSHEGLFISTILKFKENIIITVSSDKTIKFWNINLSYQQINS